MKRKPASQVLREADPDLNIIPGGVHRRDRRKKAIKLDEVSHIELPTYIPHHSNDKDWDDAGGLKCPVCGNDCVRLVSYGMMRKRQACLDCRERRRKLMEYKQRVVAPRFRRNKRSPGS